MTPPIRDSAGLAPFGFLLVMLAIGGVLIPWTALVPGIGILGALIILAVWAVVNVGCWYVLRDL